MRTHLSLRLSIEGAAFIAAFAFLACAGSDSSDLEPPTPLAPDASTSAGQLDEQSDAGTTLPNDAGADVETDDAGADADTGADAGTDPGADAGTDPGADAGTDPGADAGTDPGDSGAEPDPSALDSGVTDTPPDAGADETPLPSSRLDLSLWKLTLPVGTGNKPREIKQPELSQFELKPYFHAPSGEPGVVFRAHCGGVTTSNSGYPRSELREMTADGDLASWSTSNGRHTLTITQAITHSPEVKAHVVAGQIHDANDDVVMIRLEGRHLFVEGGGDELADLDTNYVLGTLFTVRLEAEKGRIRIYYNGELKADLARPATGCYFKAGAYTQSNTSKGDAPDAYGEVRIVALELAHE